MGVPAFSLMLDRRPAAARDADGSTLRELDRVQVVADVRGEDGELVQAGSTGTIVAVWQGGVAFEVEFMRPVEALATIEAGLLTLVERAKA